MNTHLNADFSQRVTIATERLPWIASPMAGVERRMLDRIGGEVARATSVVRYAPGSAFSAHRHDQGEEFLVLDGVFSDETGDFPAGTYVRNPPGSVHIPHSVPGCVIFVKLRQMQPAENRQVIVRPGDAAWEPGMVPGHSVQALHHSAWEQVELMRLAPGTVLPAGITRGIEEFFVLEGDLGDGLSHHARAAWLRLPPGCQRTLQSATGAVVWTKRLEGTAPVP